MKKMFLLAVFFLFAGCATFNAPHVEKLNSLSPGLTKAQLSEYFDGGTPETTQFVDGYYIQTYPMYTPWNMATHPYYFVFDQNDTLLGWEAARGQNKVVVSGVSIVLPFPSR